MKHKKLIIIVIIIFIIVICALILFSKSKNNDDQMFSRSREQFSQELGQREITMKLNSSGEIKSALIEQIEPHAGYYLEEIYVYDNQYVSKGTNLLKYTNGEYLEAPYDCCITEIDLPEEDEKIYNSHYIQVESIKMLAVSIKIDEEEINNINLGDEAQITVPAIESTYKGYVTHISSTAENGKFTVDIEFENDEKVKIGMTANIELEYN